MDNRDPYRSVPLPTAYDAFPVPAGPEASADLMKHPLGQEGASMDGYHRMLLPIAHGSPFVLSLVLRTVMCFGMMAFRSPLRNSAAVMRHLLGRLAESMDGYHRMLL